MGGDKLRQPFRQRIVKRPCPLAGFRLPVQPLLPEARKVISLKRNRMLNVVALRGQRFKPAGGLTFIALGF